MNQHNLIGGFRQFDSNFEIAQSWQRLMQSRSVIQPHNKT